MNGSRLLVEYGQGLAVITIALSVLVWVAVARRGRRFLPRGPAGWAGSLLALVVIYGSVGFLRLAPKKLAPLKSVFRQANQQAPDFRFQSLGDDSAHALSDYRGKVIVLNIWATWCAPCRKEMPDLDRLQQAYAMDGLIVIAVSDEPSSEIAKFNGIGQMQVVKGYVSVDLPTTGLYIRPDVARPVTHIIDRRGILRDTSIGGQDYASLERKILPYLKAHS